MREQLSTALREKDPAADADRLTVDQRPAAGNQLVITWTVTKDPRDQTARTRVRVDAIELLRVVKGISLSYPSVLLIANGAVLDANGAKIDAKVVHAKYSRNLIQRTNFAAVSTDQIFTLPDDKPAEIHPSYR